MNNGLHYRVVILGLPYLLPFGKFKLAQKYNSCLSEHIQFSIVMMKFNIKVVSFYPVGF